MRKSLKTKNVVTSYLMGLEKLSATRSCRIVGTKARLYTVAALLLIAASLLPPAEVIAQTYPPTTVYDGPKTVPSQAQPGYKQSYIDPVFGTKVTRISDPSMGGNEWSWQNTYSKTPAWNSDMTKIVLGYGSFILDATTYNVISFSGIRDEARWSSVDPNIIFYISGGGSGGNQFRKLNVTTGADILLHTFPQNIGMGPGEGNLSVGDGWVVLTHGTSATLYDIQNNVVVATRNVGNDAAGVLDWISMSPSGNYIVAIGPAGSAFGVRVYDRVNFGNLGIAPRQIDTDGRHADLGYDASGAEVYVADCPMEQIRLDNGVRRNLLPGTAYFWQCGHTSTRNYNLPGWSLYSDGGEVYAIKLDGSGTVRRFAHTHSTADDYLSAVKATFSPDGSKVIWNSDWGDPAATAYAYVAEMPGTSGSNLALNKPATVSSTEPGGYEAAKAVDGNTGTRWSSTFSDPQWIRVDLGSTKQINRVVLNWEAAYGSSYKIQVSSDDMTWTDIFSTTTGNGGIDDLTGLSGTGRYLRMYGTVRGTTYGYSLWEMEAYGSDADATAPTVPQGLASSSITSTSFTLSWTASTDNVGVTGYEVFKNGTSIGTTATTSMSVTGLSASTSYSMTVRARDAVPNWSAQSAALNVTTSAAGSNPISLWKFDESSGTSAADFWGANTATLTGGASFTAGHIGNALSLNGIDGQAKDISTTGLNLTSALTIAAWIKPNSLPAAAYSTIAVKGNLASARGYGFNIYDGKLNFTRMSTNVLSTVAVPTGAFHHVAVTWDVAVGQVKFYLDGVLAQTVSTTTAIVASLDSDPLTIGSWLTGGSWFNGLLDDVRIYNRALLASEITILGNGGDVRRVQGESSASSTPEKSDKLVSFQVYPNPSTGSFTIALQQPANEVSVYDNVGRNLYRKENVAKGNLTIELSGAGIYYIRVTGEMGGIKRMVILK